MARPATLDHLTKRKPVERVVTICLDDDARAALVEAESALAALPATDNTPARRKAQQEVEAARAAVDEATVSLTFQAVGRKTWEHLIDTHPPTDKDMAEWEKDVRQAKEHGEPIPRQPAFNTDAFAVAAVAACSVDPKLTEDDSRQLYDEWNATDFLRLYGACLDANMQSRVEHAGKA